MGIITIVSRDFFVIYSCREVIKQYRKPLYNCLIG